MADEELLPAVPSEGPEIVDPNNVPIVFVDWMIAGGMHSDVLNVSLGTIDHSMNKPGVKEGRIIVASRLRCSRNFAIGLHKLLGEILDGPVQPPDPSSLPKNILN